MCFFPQDLGGYRSMVEISDRTLNISRRAPDIVIDAPRLSLRAMALRDNATAPAACQ